MFVTPALRSQLNNLDDQPDRAEPSMGLPGTSSCTFVNVPHEPSYGLIVRFISGQGAESRMANPSAQVASVDGFGAVQRPGLNDRQGDESCVLIVDVADGQSLWAGVVYTGRGLSPGGYQALCEKATLAASSVLHELRSRRR
jgi:hypothetical protein